MIGKISLKNTAGHVNLPLPTVYVVSGSAATISLLDVPQTATAVTLAVTNVVGTSLSVAAEKSGGGWTATIPATHFAAAGSVENGISVVVSDGTSDWILGRGNLVVESATPTPAPGETVTPVTDKTLDGETVDVGSLAGLREAVRTLAQTMGATVTAFALCFSAFGDAVTSAKLEDLPLDTATVVTNVDLSSYATQEYVQDAITGAGTVSPEAVTNIVDGIVPAWAKAETPPQTMTTNAVQGIVTNEVQVSGEFTSWKIESMSESALPSGLAVVWGYFPGIINYADPYTGWYLEYNGQPNDSLVQPYAQDISATDLISAGDGGYPIRATRQPVTKNALGFARLVDLPHVTNGIPESISAATTTNAAQSAQIAQIGQTVNTWEGYWDGTNVIFEVTNYYGNTSGELPRLCIKEYRNNSWTNVWDEARKFEVCESNMLHAVSASNAACRAACSAELSAGLSTRAPLAWGTFTDKGTTNVVGNSVWMTSPETYFAGGTEYQRVAVGSGAVCVLVDNGALSKTVGEPGTFRFQDDGGTNYFGFAKSDSYTIGCRTDDISVEGTLITLRYDVIMGGNDVPIVYWREFIDSGSWVQLNNSDGTAADGAPYAVTWYQSGGSYYAAINCGENATGFFKAETSVAGDVVFETNMKFRAGGGIECTNTALNVMGVIKPVYNGTTVTWTWSVK